MKNVKLIFLVCLRLLHSHGGHCCPAGWTEEDGMCLTFHSGVQSWANAASVCSGMQGHLVKIKDAAEASAVVGLRLSQAQQGDPVWMGMRMESGSWQWHDGTPVTWSDWKDGSEPSAVYPTNCGTLDGATTRWSSMACEFPLAFICQYTDQTATDTMTQKSHTWQRVQAGAQYSGTDSLMTVTSLSPIQCAGQCQTVDACDAIGYRFHDYACELISGEISVSEITVSPDWELWVKKD